MRHPSVSTTVDDNTDGETTYDEEALDVLRSAGEPVLTTQEVANGMPISRRWTYNTLRELHEAGEVESKKIGSGQGTRVWWVPSRSQELSEYASSEK